MNTLKRQSDVQAESVKLDRETKLILFEAAPGKSLNLEKIYESLKETRMSGKPPGNTRAVIHYLELTATGEVVVEEKRVLLKVKGTTQQLELGHDLSARADGKGPTPLTRLLEAVKQGKKVVSVTGRVEGWSGHFPAVLKQFPGGLEKPPVLLVRDFQTAGE